MMSEEIIISDTSGPIDIVGGKRESALLLNGVPIQFTYLREVGTTWRYQIAKSISESDIIQEERFRNFVKFGFIANDSLRNQFSYIINQLSAGKYFLELGYVTTDTYLWEIDPISDYHHYDSYGGLGYLLETQGYSNEEIVDDYISLIRRGNNPIIILITSRRAKSTFILDGHHKFLAYSRLNIPARVLTINKLDAKPIDDTLGLHLLAMCSSQNSEYKYRFLNG